MGLSSGQITEVNRARLDAGKKEKAKNWNEEQKALTEIAQEEFIRNHVGQRAFRSDEHGRQQDTSLYICEANLGLILDRLLENGETPTDVVAWEYAFAQLREEGALALRSPEPYEPKTLEPDGSRQPKQYLPSLPETRVYFKQSREELLALSGEEMRRLLGGPNSAAKIAEFNRIIALR